VFLANASFRNPSNQVLLLEAGDPIKKLEIKSLVLLPKLHRSEVDWAFFGQNLRNNLDGRKPLSSRGKTLVESSLTNALAYVEEIKRL